MHQVPARGDAHAGGLRRRRPDAALMFVGEGPGEQEDRDGIPFVGRAGRLLTSLIEGIGLDRDAVYIANVVKCRPPGNRDPLPARDRPLPPLPRSPDRVHRPVGRRHARQLRDEAAARHEGWHHEAARPGVPVPRRRRRAHSDAPPGRGAAERRRGAGAGARRLRAREARARRGAHAMTTLAARTRSSDETLSLAAGWARSCRAG